MAYITAKDVAAIRSELKQAFPKWKFSVRKENNIAVSVTIMRGTAEFEGKNNVYVNRYYIDQHWQDENDRAVLHRIDEIMHNAPGRAGGNAYYDRSDIMTDYFDTAFYTRLEIGHGNQPYQKV